jgi:GDSL-like Lipase/Acylhydrolase family
MITPIVLLAPQPNTTYASMPSGSVYQSNANGLITITNGSIADEQALIAAGAIPLAPGAIGGNPAIFNFDPLFLPNWRKAKVNVREGLKNAKILLCADSIGYGYSNSEANMPLGSYLAQTGRILAANGLPVSNDNFFGDGTNTGIFATLSTADPRLTFGANWGTFLANGLGGALFTHNSAVTTDKLSFLPAAQVDSFDVYTFNQGYTLSLDINGSGATTYSPSGYQLNKTTKTGSLGSNTLNIKYSSGTQGNIYVAGVAAYNSAVKCVQMLQAGYSHATSGVWATNANPWECLTAVPFLAPDLTLIMLGMNDLMNNGAAGVGAYIANMQLLITAAQQSGSGDVILLSPTPANPANGAFPLGSVANQLLYEQARVNLALSNNVPLIDIPTRWQSYAAGNAIGLYNDTEVHPSTLGHGDIADLLAQVLLAA